MANNYFNHESPLTRHTLGRAEEVNGIFEAIVAGFDKLPSPSALLEGRVTYADDTGTANAYKVTLTVAPQSYQGGLNFVMKAANANTGPSTVDVNGLGVKPIKRFDGEDLEADDIQAGMLVHLGYDGADFRILSVHGADVALAHASALAAQSSASAAANSANSASSSAASALSLYNSFRGIYYGAQSSDPATDPNGNPVGAGDWYFNTTLGVPRIYTGSAWTDVVGVFYGRTNAEAAANVTPVDYAYPEGVPNRYAVNATPGTTDMTAAIQAAINVMVVGGCEVRLLTEDYRITDELLIPTAQGWRIVGADQKTSRIIQAADNKAIFRFTGCNNHGWKISNLWLQYVNSQATNAGAMCIAFEGDDTLPDSIAYDAEVSNLYVANAYLLAGIVSNGVIRRGVWAMRHRNLHLYTHGGIVDYGSAVAYMRAGPSMVFENVYIRGDNMTQPCMILAAGQGALRNIEANYLKTTLMDVRGGGSWFVDHVVVENMALTGANCAVINFSDVHLDVRYVHLFGNSCTWDPGVGNSAYVFRFTGGSNSTTSLNCKLLDLINFGGATTAVLSGTLFVHNAYAASGDTHVKFGDIKGLAGISNAYLTSVPASGAATCTYVEGWQREEWTTDIGDADYTVTPGVTPRNIRADSTLTANRAVILPTGSANSSCFAGMRYRIHRTAGGIGNLTIRDAASNVFATIPAGIVGTVEVTFIRTAVAATSWRVTQADLRPSTPYTVANLSVDKTYDAASTTAGELANVLGTLIQDLAMSRRLS